MLPLLLPRRGRARLGAPLAGGLGVLIVGTLIIYFGVDDIKDGGRSAASASGLVDTSGSSFPSGHAAHSVFYVWAALTLVVRLRPGMARATAVVVAGIALTALVGLSRVYLRVHYLSDVSAGWALGSRPTRSARLSLWSPCSYGRMIAVMLANLGPDDLFELWKFLINNYPQGFVAAGVVSLAAYFGLIFVPAIESYGRAWEKVAAGFLSLFVLTTMVVVGTAIGLMVFYYSNDLVSAVPLVHPGAGRRAPSIASGAPGLRAEP